MAQVPSSRRARRPYIESAELARYPALAALDGVPVSPRGVAELAGDHTEFAISNLVELAQWPVAENVRLLACRELLDRAHGKPVQSVASAFDGKLTISWMNDADNARVIDSFAT